MEDNQKLLKYYDPGRLTTSERRAYVEKMQHYLEYFQNMQAQRENSNILDRAARKIKSKDTKKRKEKEFERFRKCGVFLSKVFEKIKVEIKEDDLDTLASGPVRTTLSGAAAVNTNLAGALLGMGAGPGMAMGAGIGSLLVGGVGLYDVVAGMSDKEQAVFYKKMCETLLEVVSAFNIPEEIVKQELQKTMVRIGEIKEKYKDVSDEEEMAKRIQDECVVELTVGIEGTRDCEVFKAKVLDVMGKSAWDKMNANSQIFIVTAELLYEQWKIYEDGIDFGPICLSVSKALEVEVTRRYFIGFKEYLENTGRSLIDAMYKKDGTVKAADDYMLGDLTRITGYVADNEQDQCA